MILNLELPWPGWVRTFINLSCLCRVIDVHLSSSSAPSNHRVSWFSQPNHHTTHQVIWDDDEFTCGEHRYQSHLWTHNVLHWTGMTSPCHTTKMSIQGELPCSVSAETSAICYVCSLRLLLLAMSFPPFLYPPTSWAAVQMWTPCHSLRSHSSTFVFLWVFQAE